MRRAVTTVQLRLPVPAYRILYAMGGVEVLRVEKLEDQPEPESPDNSASKARDLLAVTLRLSTSMLDFALELASGEQAEQSEQAKPAAPRGQSGQPKSAEDPVAG